MLEEGLLKIGLDTGNNILSLLTRYMEEIELFNPAYGLVKVRGREELIAKHILDSLAPIHHIRGLLKKAEASQREAALQRQAPSVADVGSGAGLPGIPLAICMPDVNFTLIERMGRRAGFLRNAAAILGLSNIQVEETEMESPALAGRFDLIVFRAFRPLDASILKNLLSLTAPGGALAAYKGKRESVMEEVNQFVKTSDESAKLSWELFPLEVPFLDEERHLLVVGRK